MSTVSLSSWVTLTTGKLSDVTPEGGGGACDNSVDILIGLIYAYSEQLRTTILKSIFDEATRQRAIA